jgi:hypothetical protein
MVRKPWVFPAALVAAGIGCGGGLSAQDATSLREATKMSLLAYEALDAGPPRAFERAAYCATAAVLRRNDAGAPDGGGAIPCQP